MAWESSVEMTVTYISPGSPAAAFKIDKNIINTYRIRIIMSSTILVEVVDGVQFECINFQIQIGSTVSDPFQIFPHYGYESYYVT